MSGTITALKAQDRSKDRVSVYLDGKFAFGLALIHALWLRVGQALSDSEIDDLKAADTLEKAKQRAIGLISYRPRSVEEVKRRLKRVGVDDGAIEGVIASLRESGLLDDQSFSKAWVESRLGASPRSRRMIAWELRQKGVSEATISDSIENVDDEAAGLALATKHWPRFAKLESINERRRKLSEFLARHGFDYETIRDIITKLENKYGNNMGD
jgi:regulatory protein